MTNDKFRVTFGGGEALICHLSIVICHLLLKKPENRPGSPVSLRMFLCRFGIQWLIYGKMVDMVLLVVDRVFVLLGHHQTKGRAREGAKRAVAALRHVNVENISAKFNRRPFGGEDCRFVLAAFLRLNEDTIRRANPGTLPASDTVLDFVE